MTHTYKFKALCSKWIHTQHVSNLPVICPPAWEIRCDCWVSARTPARPDWSIHLHTEPEPRRSCVGPAEGRCRPRASAQRSESHSRPCPAPSRREWSGRRRCPPALQHHKHTRQHHRLEARRTAAPSAHSALSQTERERCSQKLSRSHFTPKSTPFSLELICTVVFTLGLYS